MILRNSGAIFTKKLPAPSIGEAIFTPSFARDCSQFFTPKAHAFLVFANVLAIIANILLMFFLTVSSAKHESGLSGLAAVKKQFVCATYRISPPILSICLRLSLLL